MFIEQKVQGIKPNRYFIIQQCELEVMQEQVEILLKEGWILWGDMKVTDHGGHLHYTQVMIK